MSRPAGEPLTRVLLVEDDEPLRRTLALLLRKEGFDVIEAKNGVEALRVLYGHAPDDLRKTIPPPDVIVLDILMPGINGESFLKIKEEDPQHTGLPVIILTASDVSPKSLAGAKLYIEKPITDIRQLADPIRKAAGSRRITLPPEPPEEP